jgi:phosphatidylinositol glycan class O
MQRIKGLTTGSLPTFVDISSNFGATSIEEDSLFLRLKGAGKKVYHIILSPSNH